jgi:hypothetical protein
MRSGEAFTETRRLRRSSAFAPCRFETEAARKPVAAASSTTVGECQADLQSLRAQTVAAEGSFANAKDFNGLVAKLDSAATKLTAGKNADAVQKLTDFLTTLHALAGAPRPKVDAETADGLVTEAQGVVDCINAIGAPEPV